MSFTDYLIAAPWWHWLFALLITAVIARWRPFKIVKHTSTHQHDHQHIHQGDK